MKTVRLMTCDNAAQAHIIQGNLENEGIESVLHNEHTSEILRGFCPTIAGVDIFVFDKDLEQAKKIILLNNDKAKEELICPDCGSHDITFSFKKGSIIKALFAIVLSLLCTTPPGNNYFEYKCKKCGKRFTNL